VTHSNKVQEKLLPSHVAIIMDGNGRWAENRGLFRIAGHREGVKILREIVKYSSKIGIKVLTVYAFSRENWSRPGTEVSLLIDLFMTSLKQEKKSLHNENIKLHFIGENTAFPKKLQKSIKKVVKMTSNNTGMELVIAVNYGGRWDITNAFKLLEIKIKAGQLDIDEINEDLVQSHLSISNLPEPDLFIRTGGEMRISNFLLWQLAYTELYFTESLWPDFTTSKFETALSWFAGRERRFGLTSEQIMRAEGA
jgi:undecaprenyl diphosphate synthase